jgi:hypothetical protein
LGGIDVTKVIEFPAERIAKGVHNYYPEMKERRVNTQLEAQLSYYGKHYFVDSPVELPKGRGIEFLKQYTAGSFTNGVANRKIGWYSYRVTSKAFEKLKEEYSISMERYLD